MENQIFVEYYNADKYFDVNNSFYNEIMKNFTIKTTHEKKVSGCKCPRCGSVKLLSNSGSHVCLICGDYF